MPADISCNTTSVNDLDALAPSPFDRAQGRPNSVV